jgi:hypothetical protein
MVATRFLVSLRHAVARQVPHLILLEALALLELDHAYGQQQVGEAARFSGGNDQRG